MGGTAKTACPLRCYTASSGHDWLGVPYILWLRPTGISGRTTLVTPTFTPPTCGKIPYTTIAEARLVVRNIKGRGRYIRPYKCQTCGEWHLTSRPSRHTVKKGW